jgi:hypothetical protein
VARRTEPIVLMHMPRAADHDRDRIDIVAAPRAELELAIDRMHE